MGACWWPQHQPTHMHKHPVSHPVIPGLPCAGQASGGSCREGCGWHAVYSARVHVLQGMSRSWHVASCSSACSSVGALRRLRGTASHGAMSCSLGCFPHSFSSSSRCSCSSFKAERWQASAAAACTMQKVQQAAAA